MLNNCDIVSSKPMTTKIKTTLNNPRTYGIVLRRKVNCWDPLKNGNLPRKPQQSLWQSALKLFTCFDVVHNLCSSEALGWRKSSISIMWNLFWPPEMGIPALFPVSLWWGQRGKEGLKTAWLLVISSAASPTTQKWLHKCHPSVGSFQELTCLGELSFSAHAPQ